jgi:MmyB-like transcription regulator ligand binding domain
VGANPHDPLLLELVEELSTHSEHFRRLWARHDVRARSSEVKQLRHYDVGEPALSWEALTVNGTPGQQLIIMTAEPGSSSEHALKALGRIAAQDNDLDFTPQSRRTVPADPATTSRTSLRGGHRHNVVAARSPSRDSACSEELPGSA